MGISVKDPAPGIAARIQDNYHFRQFLLATPAGKRRAAYKALVPHLKFDPWSFLALTNARKKVNRLLRTQ